MSQCDVYWNRSYHAILKSFAILVCLLNLAKNIKTEIKLFSVPTYVNFSFADIKPQHSIQTADVLCWFQFDMLKTNSSAEQNVGIFELQILVFLLLKKREVCETSHLAINTNCNMLKRERTEVSKVESGFRGQKKRGVCETDHLIINTECNILRRESTEVSEWRGDQSLVPKLFQQKFSYELL